MSANSTAVLDRAASPRFEGPIPAAGQVQAVVDAAGIAVTFSYDANGNRTEVWDALNHRTTYVYETNSNRLQAVVNALGHTVTHYYDLAGRQTAVQDARGYLTSFSYDNAGRLETQTDPLNHVTTYLYDAAGRNTTLIDANGAVKTTTFDAAGRVVSLLYADGKRVTFQYDAGGRRTTMVDWDGTTTYAYSARGELTGKTEPTGLRMTMLYDSVGNRTTLTEPDGYHYTFGYDALNRPIRLRDPNAYVLTFQYDAAGRRTTLQDSTGITRVYQYDPVGRLTTQVDSNSGGTALVTFVDGYDEVGNRTSRVKDGVATTWVYDAAYRLTNQQKSGQAATFVYDNAGNMTVKHHEGSNPLTMSYDAGNRITTSVLGSSQFTTFTHDANGNMTGERCDYLSVLSTFVYDSENRCLNELRSSGAHHTYTYAPDGLRRSAHHGGAANPVSFVWDGDDLLNEYRSGGVSCRYDVLDGEVFGERRDGSRYLYVPDPLGSVNHLLDTSQTIAGTTTYHPYGEIQSHTGPDTPLQFVGGLGYQTQIANRVYAKAGYYRPDLGRSQNRPTETRRDMVTNAHSGVLGDDALGGPTDGHERRRTEPCGGSYLARCASICGGVDYISQCHVRVVRKLRPGECVIERDPLHCRCEHGACDDAYERCRNAANSAYNECVASVGLLAVACAGACFTLRVPSLIKACEALCASLAASALRDCNTRQDRALDQCIEARRVCRQHED